MLPTTDLDQYKIYIEHKNPLDLNAEYTEYTGTYTTSLTLRELTITISAPLARSFRVTVSDKEEKQCYVAKRLSLQEGSVSLTTHILEGSGGSGSTITVDGTLDKSSTNPIQNQAVANALNDKTDKNYVDNAIKDSHKTLIVGQYNSPNYYQNDLSADIEAGITKPIFEVAIGTSEGDKQNAFTTYADGQTY